MANEQSLGSGLAWHEVEAKVLEEIRWLKLAIVEFSNNDGIKSAEESYRRIATMIIQGKARVTEFRAKDSNVLWKATNSVQPLGSTKHKHGKDWYRSMMDLVDGYFVNQGYEVVTEPHLNSGRADLGVFMEGKKDLYVEIGSTSVDKLAINLASMPDCVFLFMPEGNRAIEFVT